MCAAHELGELFAIEELAYEAQREREIHAHRRP